MYGCHRGQCRGRILTGRQTEWQGWNVSTTPSRTLLSPLRPVIVGNCQAAALATVAQMIVAEVEVQRSIIVHLPQPFATAKRNFRLPFAQGEVIKNPFEFSVTTRLNLYYRGQNPELFYRRELTDKVLFPLGDYHIETAYDAFVEGVSGDETLKRMGGLTWNRSQVWNGGQQSLEDLQSREAHGDAAISDQIALREALEPLFFTFNHPSPTVAGPTTPCVYSADGVEADGRLFQSRLQEPLGRVVVPPNPMIPRGQRTAVLLGPRKYRGLDRAERQDGPQVHVRTLMSEREVVEGFCAAYRESGVLLTTQV